MSAVPVRGRAVQAPIVSVPISVPRVVVVHVVPTTTMAAIHNASMVPKMSRTVLKRQFLRDEAASPVAAARLSGKGSSLADTGLPGWAASFAHVVEHLFHLHQDFGAAPGQDRRRTRLDFRGLRRAAGCGHSLGFRLLG